MLPHTMHKRSPSFVRELAEEKQEHSEFHELNTRWPHFAVRGDSSQVTLYLPNMCRAQFQDCLTKLPTYHVFS
jgi:hypothetical protein